MSTMSNAQIRRRITAATGAKIDWYVRQYSPCWYMSEAHSGDKSVFFWSYHDTRAGCYHALLRALLAKATSQ